MSKRIDQFPSTAVVGVADLLAVMQGGVTKRAALSGSFTFGEITTTTLSVLGTLNLTNVSAGGTLSVTGISTFSSPLRAADGSVAAPSYSFTNSSGSGWSLLQDSVIGSAAGTRMFSFGSGGVFVDINKLVVRDSVGSSATLTTPAATPHILELRDGVNAQTLRIYKTFTDFSNFERFEIVNNAAGATVLRTVEAGTGAARDLEFGVNGGAQWRIEATSAHFKSTSDNALDIGASGANRPRTGYFGTSISVIGTVSGTGVVAVGNGAAPTAQTDTVALYSTDDAAGHTIPSFFCEGTNVLATGQADSASSVRVKMRINGTVVTLLAI